jgi:hypothetical protein
MAYFRSMAMHFRVLMVITCLTLCVGCKKPYAETSPVSAPGSKYLDAFNWVQYGNMPLVISVPHGGTVAPDSIADRTCAGITTALDTYTIELARAIDSVFQRDYGIKPYLITTDLRRVKLDQNREWGEATCSTNTKTYLWNNFHNAIDTCIQKAIAVYSNCLYIDLHGHGHSIQRLELGYLVNTNGLQNVLGVNASNTSIGNLLAISSTSFTNLLTGTNAFGTLMAAKGFPSVPSATDPAPQTGDLFFDGGYNTSRYTNRATYPKVFGWQIESNYDGVRNTSANRGLFAKAFAQSIIQFFSTHTSIDTKGFGR